MFALRHGITEWCWLGGNRCVRYTLGMDISQESESESRRGFLRKGSGVLAAVGASSVAGLAHGAPDNRLKLGVIGCGGRGTGAANQASTLR